MENMDQPQRHQDTPAPPAPKRIRKALSALNVRLIRPQHQPLRAFPKSAKNNAKNGNNKENVNPESLPSVSLLLSNKLEKSTIPPNEEIKHDEVEKTKLEEPVKVNKKNEIFKQPGTISKINGKPPRAPRILTQNQILFGLMGQLRDLFNGLPPKNIGLEKLAVIQSIALCEPYRLDALQFELEKERRYTLAFPYPKDCVDLRRVLVDRIISTNDNNGHDEETLHACVYIADAFLLKVDEVTRADLNWDFLVLAVVSIAGKSQFGNDLLKELFVFQEAKAHGALLEIANLEAKILKVLNFYITPPTPISFKELVINQMDFPTPIMRWLTSFTADKVLRESLLSHRLASASPSKKAKLVVQICTKYFVKESASLANLGWDDVNNCPILEEGDDYMRSLTVMAASSCIDEFRRACASKRSPIRMDLQPKVKDKIENPNPRTVMTRSKAAST